MSLLENQYNSFNNWGWIDTMPKKILKEVELVHGDIRDADFIRNNSSLMKKIKTITDAEIEDGGSGAFYIFLKKKL